MLSDFEKNILSVNGISEENVKSVSSTGLVTFLDNTQRQICERWTRVMGYFRPYSSFNIGKKAEFNERKNFEESKVIQHI